MEARSNAAANHGSEWTPATLVNYEIRDEAFPAWESNEVKASRKRPSRHV
jgi:hypothetical protein